MSKFFKIKIDERLDGKIDAITVRNQKMNFHLFTFLHQVVHTAIKIYNGDWGWMDYRITFEHKGRRYVQVNGCPCCDCCFFGKDELERPNCNHPYKDKPAGKGVCDGLVYRVTEEKL